MRCEDRGGACWHPYTGGSVCCADLEWIEEPEPYYSEEWLSDMPVWNDEYDCYAEEDACAYYHLLAWHNKIDKVNIDTEHSPRLCHGNYWEGDVDAGAMTDDTCATLAAGATISHFWYQPDWNGWHEYPRIGTESGIVTECFNASGYGAGGGTGSNSFWPEGADNLSMGTATALIAAYLVW